MSKPARTQDPPAPPQQLTRYERVAAVGVRMEQLARGSPPLVTPSHPKATLLEIAEQELQEGRMPFTVVRTMPDGTKVHLALTTRPRL